eukprot:364173-Chlamydomonas_euryale.AAC.9
MAQPDVGLGYLLSDGSTLSEDDGPQQNDAGAIASEGAMSEASEGARDHRRCQPSGQECARHSAALQEAIAHVPVRSPAVTARAASAEGAKRC